MPWWRRGEVWSNKPPALSVSLSNTSLPHEQSGGDSRCANGHRVICLFALVYPLGYNALMIEIRQTEVYANWFAKLRDRQARVRLTCVSAVCR